jgi:hypothetical protein
VLVALGSAFGFGFGFGFMFGFVFEVVFGFAVVSIIAVSTLEELLPILR